jgi:hypothetical protein
MKNLAHSASLHAGENNAPSNPGIKHLLSTANADLAPNLLNIIEDLVTHQQPTGLPANVPAIRDALVALGQRLPSMSAHTEKIRVRLPQANRS